jgi:UDP-glucose 4-epimerase
MNILVVGGAGYIGSHVAKELIKQGHQVTVFDNLSSGLKENILPGSAFIEGDITKPEEINQAMVGQSAVVHLAAFKSVGESMQYPEKYSHNNLYGTLNILNAMSQAGVKKIIFSSSAATYGEPKYLPIDENHPTEPINYYGFTKLEIEKVLQWYSQLKEIRFAALRYFNAVGYDHEGELTGLEKNPQNLIPVIMEVLTGQREKLQIFGNDWPTPDGTCIRDYIHVDDLATAHAKALNYLEKENKDLIVNLATGSGLSVKEIVDEAKKQSGVDFKVELVSRRAGDPSELYASNQLAQELLDWQPEYSDLQTIVATTLRAYGIK